MGYLTPILLYNDTIHEMKEDPTFTKKLYDAAISGKDDLDVFYQVGNGSGSCAQVLRAKHADDSRTLVVWGNTWWDLSDYAWRDDEALRKYFNSRMPDVNTLKTLVRIAKQDIKQIEKKIKEMEGKK